MHRRIIMSHNWVTEIKKKLSRSKIGQQLAFHQDMMWKLHFAYLFLHWHRSRHHVFVPIRNLYGDLLEAICKGKILQVQHASLSANVTYRALRWAQDRICSCLTAASHNLAQYDDLLVEKSNAARAIFRGQSQETPQALQMISVQVPLQHHPFVVEQRPEPSIRMCQTSHLFHGSRRLHLPIPVGSIDQASSASAETSLWAAVPFWWLCPSPSRVRHLRSACPAVSLHHAHLLHPPHSQNLQDHSDCHQ